MYKFIKHKYITKKQSQSRSLQMIKRRKYLGINTGYGGVIYLYKVYNFYSIEREFEGGGEQIHQYTLLRLPNKGHVIKELIIREIRHIQSIYRTYGSNLKYIQKITCFDKVKIRFDIIKVIKNYKILTNP